MNRPGAAPLHVSMDFLTRNIQRLPAEQHWQALYTVVASLVGEVDDDTFRNAVLNSVSECAKRGIRCRPRSAA